MNILLVSECTKNALKETRRVLDQFAERTGQRTWQTVITDAGLKTLHQLLRKTARRNSAIACFWTRGKNRTDLLWIVGDRTKFNHEGRIPTNRTKRNILRAEDENEWRDGATIQILATLAALLHDIGKATVGFQKKLWGKDPESYKGDPYRHEWISLQLFKLMIKGCKTNEVMLERLANFEDYRKANPDWHKTLNQSNKGEVSLFHQEMDHPDYVPPIAQIVGWLIVSHHRQHLSEATGSWEAARKVGNLKQYQINEFYEFEIKAAERWVRNAGRDDHPSFWQLEYDITQSEAWQKSLTRWANKALRHAPLMDYSTEIMTDPSFFYYSRLALIVGDHNYSRLAFDSHRRVKGDDNFPLIANTLRESPVRANQFLDEHLIGVANFTAYFARLLNYIPHHLPTIEDKRTFRKPTTEKRFSWQNRAFNRARELQKKSESQGFFGINMASTGCGKTLGNARIIYALADENRGARFTIALGLRVLTLQTGEALREMLNLNDEELAILVGGAANRTLFELAKKEKDEEITEQGDFNEARGSESAGSFIGGEVNVAPSMLEDPIYDRFGSLIDDPKSRDLLFAPIVSCTIDHLMGASETMRGGGHIAPLLRLLSGDLILDEPDAYNIEDYPALSRLLFLTGLMGSRVLLSSATLTPDFVAGLFRAYQKGYRYWQRGQGIEEGAIVTAWFDEFKEDDKEILDADQFLMHHQSFVDQRLERLSKEPVRRQATILSLERLPPKPESEDLPYDALMKTILSEAYRLHSIPQNHEIDPKSGKKISIGIIRIAHIKHIIQLVKAAYQPAQIPDNTHFHLVTYHARQLLYLRSRLENHLDRILDRKNPAKLFNDPMIRKAIEKSGQENHIFIIVASPIIETGRDFSAHWAIAEPSEMKGVIQLAGRVWRHQPEKVAAQENISILGTNLKALVADNLGIGNAVFQYPGFEDRDYLLASHRSADIFRQEELARIDSAPRIKKLPIELEGERYHYLSDLEHARIEALLNPADKNFITAFYDEKLALCAATSYLQQISPFRYNPMKKNETEFVLLPDDESPTGFSFYDYDGIRERLSEYQGYQENSRVGQVGSPLKDHPNISPWLSVDFKEELQSLQERLQLNSEFITALRFARVVLDGTRIVHFHPDLGFWYQE